MCVYMRGRNDESLGNVSRDGDVMVMGGASIICVIEMRSVVRRRLSAI